MEIKINKQELIKACIMTMTTKEYIEKAFNPYRVIRNKPNKDELYKALIEWIFVLSQQYVPVKTGRLKRSGQIIYEPDGKPSIIYDTPYALYVHEIIDNRHATPTKAKFLEDAAWEALTQFDFVPFTFSMESYNEHGIKLKIDSLSFEEFSNDMLQIMINKYISGGDISLMDYYNDNYKYREGLNW